MDSTSEQTAMEPFNDPIDLEVLHPAPPPSPSSPDQNFTFSEPLPGYVQVPGRSLFLSEEAIEWPETNGAEDDDDEGHRPLTWEDFPSRRWRDTPRRPLEEIEAKRNAAREGFRKPAQRTKVKAVSELPADDGCDEWDKDWDFDDMQRHALLDLSTREFVERHIGPAISAIVMGRTWLQPVGGRIFYLGSVFRWLAKAYVATHGDAGQLLILADYVAQHAEELGVGDFWVCHENRWQVVPGDPRSGGPVGGEGSL